MNNKHIKRQITLYKLLGLCMDEDIKDYYDNFHSLIGNVDELEELTHDDYPNSIFWRKNGKEVILEYDTKNEHFYVRYDTIWEKFEEKYKLNYDNISELLSGLLEEAFKLRVTTAKLHLRPHLYLLEEAFELRVTTAFHCFLPK